MARNTLSGTFARWSPITWSCPAITGLQVYGGSEIRPETLATAEQDVVEPTTAGATE